MVGGEEVLDVGDGGLGGVEVAVGGGEGEGVGGGGPDVVRVDVLAKLLFSGGNCFVFSLELLDVFFQLLTISFVFTFVVKIHQYVTEIHFDLLFKTFSFKVFYSSSVAW